MSNEKDWIDIMENDGMGRFEDGERVEWSWIQFRGEWMTIMSSNSIRWVFLFYSTNSIILTINTLHRP